MCNHCTIKKYGSGSRTCGGKTEPMYTYYAGEFFCDMGMQPWEAQQIIYSPKGAFPEKFYLGQISQGGIKISHCPWCGEELFAPLDLNMVEEHESAQVTYYRWWHKNKR